MSQLLWLILGGSLGTLSRYSLSLFMTGLLGASFPYGTLLVNLLGCFLIGMLEGLPEGVVGLPAPIRLLFVTGFLGALTTFSTFSYDSHVLMGNGDWTKVSLNILTNVVLGLVMLNLGLLMVRVTLGFIRPHSF